MLKKIKNKITARGGETLVETLAGIVIVALCFVMLAGAIVAAAKANNAIQNTDTAYVYDLDDLEKQTDHDNNPKNTTKSEGTIKITHDVDSSEEEITVDYYTMSITKSDSDKESDNKVEKVYTYYQEQSNASGD